MKRRQFLKVAGSTSVILAAAGAGIGGFVATRTPHSALLPWSEAAQTQYPDPVRRALSYAILAPNPHNRQPWQVAIRNDTEAVLTCDLERMLPATDPFDRQIVIGLGCFLEQFAVAATRDGYRAVLTLFPEGEPGVNLDSRPVAHLKLTQDPALNTDPLFASMLTRRTNRNAYDLERPVAEQVIGEVLNQAYTDVRTGAVVSGSRLGVLRNLTRDALRDEILDREAFQESVDLMRIGRAEIEANPDGIYLGGAFLEALSLLGMLSREHLADPESQAFQVGLDMADEQAGSAMGFFWVNTGGNNRFDQIAAGRSYLRIALAAARIGLAMQPMSQALQEYAAMRPHYENVHSLLADPGERVQMLARIGYAEPAQPAPRWPLTTRIKT